MLFLPFIWVVEWHQLQDDPLVVLQRHHAHKELEPAEDRKEAKGVVAEEGAHLKDDRHHHDHAYPRRHAKVHHVLEKLVDALQQVLGKLEIGRQQHHGLFWIERTQQEAVAKPLEAKPFTCSDHVPRLPTPENRVLQWVHAAPWQSAGVMLRCSNNVLRVVTLSWGGFPEACSGGATSSPCNIISKLPLSVVNMDPVLLEVRHADYLWQKRVHIHHRKGEFGDDFAQQR